MVAQRHPEVVEPEQSDLYQIGSIALVKQMVKLPGKVVRVLVEGLERAELISLEEEGVALMAQVAPLTDQEEELDHLVKEAMVRILKEKLEEYGKVNANASHRLFCSPVLSLRSSGWMKFSSMSRA